jgi:hypothetical protein
VGEELYLAARQAACTSLDALLKNAVSKKTIYETASTAITPALFADVALSRKSI